MPFAQFITALNELLVKLPAGADVLEPVRLPSAFWVIKN
jgi:hypothetical protein